MALPKREKGLSELLHRLGDRKSETFLVVTLLGSRGNWPWMTDNERKIFCRAGLMASGTGSALLRKGEGSTICKRELVVVTLITLLKTRP